MSYPSFNDYSLSDYLANLMRTFYQNLSKNSAYSNGKITDISVRMDGLEKSVAKIHKYIDFSEVHDTNNDNDQRQSTEETKRTTPETMTLPIATIEKVNEFD